jgi:hypothetical protein
VKLNRLIFIDSVAAFALVMVISTSVAAQARPNPRTSTHGRPPDSVTEMRERDMNIRRLELERESKAKPTLEVSKETIKQVNEDFARIQEINSEVIHDYVSGKSPDYRRISEAMAEIRKRASRLQTNLLLPANDDAEGEPAASRGASNRAGRSPLLDLNDLIFSFVTNPIFKNENTIDLALGAKAKHDLASIVDLSDRISRGADKLNKTARASQ